MSQKFEIHEDDLSDGQLIKLLELHRIEMLKHSPIESVHALDLAAMRSTDLSFWSIRSESNSSIVACGALKYLDESHAELKSMKVSESHIGHGLGRLMLNHLLTTARQRGFKKLSLETGTMDAFIPARTLYLSSGFKECPPFSGYQEDPNSVCMSMLLN